MKKLNKGFTLVELIIVVTILAILATVAFLTLGNYPADARNSKRLGQAKSIYNKIEILKAKEAKEYKDYVKDAAPTTSSNGFTEVQHGFVDFTKIQESETAFALPTAEEKYYVVTGTETAPGFKCIQIFTKRETASATEPAYHVSGNCTKNIVSDDVIKDQVGKKSL